MNEKVYRWTGSAAVFALLAAGHAAHGELHMAIFTAMASVIQIYIGSTFIGKQ